MLTLFQEKADVPAVIQTKKATLSAVSRSTVFLAQGCLHWNELWKGSICACFVHCM